MCFEENFIKATLRSEKNKIRNLGKVFFIEQSQILTTLYQHNLHRSTKPSSITIRYCHLPFDF